MSKRVIIIGGGASGITAAVYAAAGGAAVTILEHTERIGKKILSTGNGKCNMTNLYMESECFRCSQPDFPMKVIRHFGVEETLKFFKELGVVPKIKNGYVYPNSEQASAVLDVLRSELEHLGVKIVTNCKTGRISISDKNKFRFKTDTDKGAFEADALIISAGSMAAPVTGSDGSGYKLLRELGHHIIKPLPALVQLRCREKFYKQLAGIRTEAAVSIFADKKLLAKETGELQLTDYGISGIPVFQVSRFAAKALDAKKKVTAELDFFCMADEQELYDMLNVRRQSMKHKKAEEFFTGFFNRKLAGVLLKESGIKLNTGVAEWREQEIKRLCGLIKHFKTEVTETNPFTNAQVCCGGVDTKEINPDTMESRIVENLYITGEILDVDGICGGYNLQWAWASGSIAGENAGRGKA